LYIIVPDVRKQKYLNDLPKRQDLEERQD